MEKLLTEYVSSKRWYLPITLHGVTTLKNIISITAVTTLSLRRYNILSHHSSIILKSDVLTAVKMPIVSSGL
jgi:hypothetical protein